MSPWLVTFIIWCLSPSFTSPGIAQTTVEGLKLVEGRLAISATVVNSTSVVDPTIRLPGFDLHRRQWSLLNRQGHCNACHKKWGFIDNELTVEKSRQCHTSSTLVHWTNLTAVYCAYMKQMRLPSTGWQHNILWLLAYDNNKKEAATTNTIIDPPYRSGDRKNRHNIEWSKK